MSKKHKKYRLHNKKSFVRSVCSECNVCGINPNPTFCYSMYQSNPTGFMTYAYERLSALAEWPGGSTSRSYIDGNNNLKPLIGNIEGLIINPNAQLGKILFKDIFCKKRVCLERQNDEDECPLLLDCMMEHHKQMMSGVFPNSIVMSNKVTAKNIVKVKTTPLFFCKPESEEEIRKILSEK